MNSKQGTVMGWAAKIPQMMDKLQRQILEGVEIVEKRILLVNPEAAAQR